MKKVRTLLFIPLVLGMLVGCNKDIDPVPVASSENQPLNMSGSEYLLDFYSINDLHGSVVENKDVSNPEDREAGMSKIGSFIRNKRNQNLGGSFFISNGDAYQGSADSNITGGKIVMEMFNLLDFEVNTVGNHEFDWSIQTLLANMSEMDVKYPLLACNIINKALTAQTAINSYVDWAEPYKIIERGTGQDKVKVGIIGSIAYGLENSIAASMVRDFAFLEPTARVIELASELRNDQDCDVIIYATHGDAGTSGKGATVNTNIANYVDAIFTGHAHRYWDTPLTNSLGNPVPVLQGRSNGKAMSYVQLAVDKMTRAVRAVNHEVLDYDDLKAFGNDPSIDSVYNRWYKDVIQVVKNRKVGSVSREISKDTISGFLADEMLRFGISHDSTVVAAFHNGTGGIRDVLRKGNITFGDIYKVLPFDNSLYFVTVQGFYITGGTFALLNGTRGSTVDGTTFLPSAFYRIVLLSYVAEHTSVNMDGSDPSRARDVEIVDKYPRDLIADAFTNHPSNRPFD